MISQPVDLPDLKKPIELLPLFRERPWGRENLGHFFQIPEAGRRVGEVWFTFQENKTSYGRTLGELLLERPEILGAAGDSRHPGVCPLLVKLLFTAERLSVQVHPGDEYAEKHHGSLGKTEAWYVLDAQPPGELAVGFKQVLTAGQLRELSNSGEIENFLDWQRVHAGDVIFVPAGTVHAIGAGLTICEIQENSDITYRLYDYGRPRELHLEHGMAVSDLGPHRFAAAPVVLASWRTQLLECSYFRIERLRPQERIRFSGDRPYYLLLICTHGTGSVAGQPGRAGQSWIVPARSSEFAVDGPDSEWILAYTASAPALIQEGA